MLELRDIDLQQTGPIKMDRQLIVSMISTSYPRSATDWRGVFIRHIAKAISEIPGINLHLWSPPGDMPPHVFYACESDEAKWLDRLMEKGGIAHALRQKKMNGLITSIKLLLLLKKAYQRSSSQADLYHINWLQNTLPLPKGRQPVLVSVLGQDFGLLKLPAMTAILRHKIKQRPYYIAPNAEWMVPELKQRFGDIAIVRAIPFGIDVAWYQINRNWQEIFPRKWLLVSRLTTKKIGPLFEWGQSIFQDENELHIFGPMQEKIELPKWVHYHGSTYPDQLIEQWFPQAAGLITLSQHDEGRPQIMLEAMAAGLPILASPLPAHKDLLVHRQTGCLVDSLEQFEAEIRWLNDPENNLLIAEQARTWVKIAVGTWSDCAERYIAAYHDLMEQN
jgi:glycosyltransferase involved in cell wall biosynthesis